MIQTLKIQNRSIYNIYMFNGYFNPDIQKCQPIILLDFKSNTDFTAP